jgi:WD40 repeat protein
VSGDGLFLRDLEKGVDIWHDNNLFAWFGALMFWSPDSQTVAYANLFASPEERTVVLISRDGLAQPIMGNTLPLSELLVDDLRWSPDGQYIALLVWEGETTGESIIIYDFAAQKYISRCPIPRSGDRTPNLIWSPDNKFLAYVGVDYPLIIMNVQSGELFQLVNKARAVGWSDKFPVIWNSR